MVTLANVRLVDPEGDRVVAGGLVIADGRIAEVFEGGRDGLDCGGRHLAPGIIDIGVKVGEPGERHKESFRTAGAAAAAGGVTTMVTRPDTIPPIDDPETFEFILRRAVAASPVHVRPMAALTKGREGREMTEIGFLMDAGAAAFTDAAYVASARVLQRALTYAAGLGALVVGHPQEPASAPAPVRPPAASPRSSACRTCPPSPSASGSSATSPWSRSTGARYHADQISVADALPALRRAKAAGLRVTAGASIHHLTLNELDVGDYRTFFKLTPPLRSEDDRMALVDALAEGLIDVVGSFHTPQDEEEKRLPFEEAAAGAVGLETLLPAAMQLFHAGHLTLPALWRALALNPARLLGLDAGRLAAGAPADLVLFDPDAPFVLDRATLRSKSKNTPYDLRRMQGRVLRTWVAGRQVYGAGADDARADLPARLSPRLDTVRRGDRPRPRPRRPAPHRLGQHRRDQRSAHRQQGRRARRRCSSMRRRGRWRSSWRGISQARRRPWSRGSARSSAISFPYGWAFAGERAWQRSSA